MKVFVTGASGFIGTAITGALIEAGHQVIGLARSEESAKKIKASGAEVLRGTLEALDILRQGASQADGVIHAGFIHDFTQYAKANEVDTTAINVMGEALMGTNKPMVVTSGILGLPPVDGAVTEDSRAINAPRGSEITTMALAAKGVNASVVRLPPSVHDKGDKGFIPFIIGQARKNGVSAYVEEGNNRWSAVHRLDAAQVFRLAIEKAEGGAVYNAVGDSGFETKEIARWIGEKLNMPVVSLSGDAAVKHFEWMSGLVGMEGFATSHKTQALLGWKPLHVGLFDDMQQNYF